jgi:CheY-like chemotaxis protein
MTAKATVLVIDDEPDVREMIETGLSLSGYEVLTATGGLHAISIAHARPVDAVISDFKMPGMDGSETIAQLKRIIKNAVYILCTGYLDHVGLEKCIELGAEQLRKPFTPRELERILERGLRKLASR